MGEENRRWRCPYCDGLNDWQNTVCEICGEGRRDETLDSKRTTEIPNTYTPQPNPEHRTAERDAPRPVAPETELRDAPPAPEPKQKGKGATIGFFVLAAAFAALAISDGVFAWFLISAKLGLAGTILCPLSDHSYGYLSVVFLGLMPLAAQWLRSKGARGLAILLAAAGFACSAAAAYAMLLRSEIFAVGWLLYAVAALLALIHAVTGSDGRALGGICMALGIASLVLTLWLATFMYYPGMLGAPGDLEYVGTRWLLSPNAARALFSSRESLRMVHEGPASAGLPFSRGLVILAMSFGFRLQPRER